LLLEIFPSHSSWYLSQVGCDTEVLRRLEAFGLGEVHIQSFFGKVQERVESHGEWLIERREVECDREPTLKNGHALYAASWNS
jgi:hypothetical protein